MDKQMDDEARRAIREAEAQLAVIKTLAPLPRASREMVLGAVSHILEAEKLVPGVLEMFLKQRTASRGLFDQADTDPDLRKKPLAGAASRG